MTRIVDFVRSKDGATSIEYALIAAVLGIAVVTSIGSLSPVLQGLFSTISSKF